MNNVKIIAASAGSGKTFRLAQVLHDEIAAGHVRPEAVIATTFTKKAAAELQQRARTALLEKGLVSEAQRLTAARIGTVNSVCDRLVSQFAFRLGLPPRVGVLDEVAAAEHLNRALASVIGSDIDNQMQKLKWRLGRDFDWRADVKRIIQLARSNGIGAEELEDHAERSIERMLGFFSIPSEDGAALDRALEAALDEFVCTGIPQHDGTKKSAEAMAEAKRYLAAMRRFGEIPWGDWAKLENLRIAKRSEKLIGSLVGAVNTAAAAHDYHPQLQRDLREAIGLTYFIAKKTLSTFQAIKRAWGVIDFVDQEVYALRLLSMPEVQRAIAGDIDLLLVDEFQDTSPLQLAVFVALSRVATRCIWVGDQKQAIFGFRGTDPALMTAAIDEFLSTADPSLVDDTVEDMLGSNESETLGTSYRSRPDLVRLTSDVFVPAFGRYGMPESRVRLEPAKDDEPAGLGEIAEFWSLHVPDKRKSSEYAHAVAAGVAELLAAKISVRTKSKDAIRPVAPGDIAVLCRTNTDCARVADALEDLDIRAVVPRVGLLATLEGRVALTALRYWVDCNDRHAAAELAYLIAHADTPDKWLDIALTDRETHVFQETPVIANLRKAREQYSYAGALEALDRGLTAIDLAHQCRRWGESDRRLANLEALRAHAVHYEQLTQSAARSATPAALYAHFLELQAEHFGKTRDDSQAVRASHNGVTVTTWHRAKGLEWPVAILFGLDRLNDPAGYGVDVVSDTELFDLQDPLAGRWICVTPTPYPTARKSTRFYDRLQQDPHAKQSREEARREALRLLYVGWTRARDRLVFAMPEATSLDKGILGTLSEVDSALISAPTASPATWAGHEFELVLRKVEPEEPAKRSIEPGETYLLKEPVEYPPAFVSPSRLPHDAQGAIEMFEIGPAWTIPDGLEPRALGQAVHAFFAADDTHEDRKARTALARRSLDAWLGTANVDPNLLVDTHDRLDAWIRSRWPGSSRQHEWPVLHRLASGQMMRGTPDLVVTTSDGFAVIDHKSAKIAREDAADHAAGYAGQLRAYAQALAAASNTSVPPCFVHLSTSGLMVRVG